MAFNMKTWVDRITEYPTRRRLRKEDGSDELVTVSREEGQVSEEGDAFSAENMNDLESRIDSAFKDVNNSLVWKLLKQSTGNNLRNYELPNNYTEFRFIATSTNYMFCVTYPYDIISKSGTRSITIGTQAYGGNNVAGAWINKLGSTPLDIGIIGIDGKTYNDGMFYIYAR